MLIIGCGSWWWALCRSEMQVVVVAYVQLHSLLKMLSTSVFKKPHTNPVISGVVHGIQVVPNCCFHKGINVAYLFDSAILLCYCYNMCNLFSLFSYCHVFVCRTLLFSINLLIIWHAIAYGTPHCAGNWTWATQESVRKRRMRLYVFSVACAGFQFKYVSKVAYSEQK